MVTGARGSSKGGVVEDGATSKTDLGVAQDAETKDSPEHVDSLAIIRSPKAPAPDAVAGNATAEHEVHLVGRAEREGMAVDDRGGTEPVPWDPVPPGRAEGEGMAVGDRDGDEFREPAPRDPASTEAPQEDSRTAAVNAAYTTVADDMVDAVAVTVQRPRGFWSSVGHVTWKAWSPAALAAWILWLGVVLLFYRFGYRRATPGPADGLNKASLENDPKHVFAHGHFNCGADPTVAVWSFLCPGIRWAETVSLLGISHFWVAFAGYSFLALLNYMNFYSITVAAVGTIVGCGYLYAKAIDQLVPQSNEDPQANMIVRLVVGTVALVYYLMAVLSLGTAVLSLLWSPGVSHYMGLEGCFTWGVFTAAAMLHCRQRLRAALGLEHHDITTCAGDWCFLFWCPWCAVAQEARVINAAYRTEHPAVKAGPAEDFPNFAATFLGPEMPAASGEGQGPVSSAPKQQEWPEMKLPPSATGSP